MSLSQSRAPQSGAEWSGSDDDGGEDFLVRKGAPDTHLSDEEEVWWSFGSQCSSDGLQLSFFLGLAL
jgi:hypothetical protein